MAYLNRFTCIGRLTDAPRMAATQNTGASVAHFTVAVNRRYRRQDGNTIDETTFVEVEAWRGLADYCRNYLDKGMEIYCEGRLSIQKYTDQNNQPRERPIVTLDGLQLLSRTAAQEAAVQQGGNAAQVPAQAPAQAPRNMPQPQMTSYQPPQQLQQQQPVQRPPVPNYPAPAMQPLPQQPAAPVPQNQPMAQQPAPMPPAAPPAGQPAAPQNPYADMSDIPF